MATLTSYLKIGDGFSDPLARFSNSINKGISSVGKLKNSLHFGGNISPPTGKFNEFNGSLERSNSLLRTMVGANIISGGISKGIGMLTGEAESLIHELNESSKAWQTFDGNMRMFGASQKEIISAKKDMQQYAQATIYSSSDMASTYSQLRATGVKNTGRLVKGFGGLAASAQDPVQAMKTLSQQGTQMAAKPMIQWQDLKLMMEQAPAGISAVAKTMHMSATQLLQDVQKGKVKTTDFFDAVAKTGTNKSFTQMATHYKTVGQAMDGLRETVANQLQPAFDKVGKVGIKAISGLIDKVGDLNFDQAANKITPVLQGTINTIVDGFNYAKGAVSDFFAGFNNTGAVSAIRSTIGTVKQDLSSMSKSMAGSGKDPFAAFKTLGSISGGAIGGLAKTVGALADNISRIDPTIIKTLALAFVALKFGLKGLVFTSVIAFLNIMNKTNPKTANALAKGIIGVAIAIGVLNGAMKAYKSFKVFMGLFNKTPKAPKTPTMPKTPKAPEPPGGGAGQWIKFGAALILVGVAVIAVGVGFYILAQAAIQLSNAGWGAVAVFAGMIALVAALGIVVATVGTAMIAGAVGFTIFGVALLLIAGAIWIVSAGMTMLAGALPTIAQYGLMASVGILALGAAILVFSALAAASIVGITIFSAGLLILSVAMVVTGAAGLVLAVGITAVAGALMLLGAALTMVGAGLTAVAGGAQNLASTLGGIFNGMVNTIRGTVSSIPGVVRGGIQGAVGIAQGFGGALVGAGSAIINGFLNGIKSAFEGVKSFVGGIAGWIKAHKGPLSYDKKLLTPAGNFIMNGLNDGLTNGFGDVKNNVNGMTENLANTQMATPNIAMGGLNGSNPGDLLANGFDRAKTSLYGLVSGMSKLKANGAIDVNGQMQDNNIKDTNQLTSNPDVRQSLGLSSNNNDNSQVSNSSNTDNSKSDRSIVFETGAIQINSNGNAEYDGEKLLAAIEPQLKAIKEGRLSN
ncbi:hypothetical protein DY037_07230 [Apilactobacillus micheneri]|uniref:tape measure protein n=1 Tax=Apilactobacillus micheneri TaxID=1899430 RepID=UPI001126F5EB|nr:tape measure protein [Apilactobacillus micheneri]TPR48176.1 hypothetical protein DY037_07230 [Apilactobacillus micheneri]